MFSTLIIRGNVSLASNQYIRTISEESCDWSRVFLPPPLSPVVHFAASLMSLGTVGQLSTYITGTSYLVKAVKLA